MSQWPHEGLAVVCGDLGWFPQGNRTIDCRECQIGQGLGCGVLAIFVSTTCLSTDPGEFNG